MKVSLEKLRLDLKVNWKLSRNETLFKENFILSLAENGKIAKGEIAPNIRYNENEDKINRDFATLQKRILNEDLDFIRKENDFCNSFNFALNSAYVDLTVASFYDYFNVEAIDQVATSYSVPIMEEDLLKSYLIELERFPFIKIKINKDNAISFVKKIASYTNRPLRIDGNEAFDSLDEYLVFEKAIENINVQFIEQPFKATAVDFYKQLKPISKYEIIADESIESQIDFDEIEQCFHGVNMKLMKAGSFERGIEILKEAKRRKLKTMIGCMIETSLGISHALRLCSLADYVDLDGSLLLKKEPFNLIKELNGHLSFS